MNEPKTAEERVEDAHSEYASRTSYSMNPIDSFTEFKAGWIAAAKTCCSIALDECNTCFGSTKVSDEDLRERPCPACTDQLSAMREKLGVKT